MMKVKTVVSIFGILISAALSAQIAVKNGDVIAFLGDSITAYGNSVPAGYVNLVMSGLKTNGIEAVKIPSGFGGHNSVLMLERLERHILKKKPQIMLLSCGVNDVWYGKRGVQLEDYRKNITEIVTRTQAAGIKVGIMTATMIFEKPDGQFNRRLAEYNKFLRKLAAEKKCLLIDLNADQVKFIKDFKAAHPKAKGNLLTVDGVHMNTAGNELMAIGILRAFGLNDEQIAKARTAWAALPGRIGIITVRIGDIEKIMLKAAGQGKSIEEYVEALIHQDASKN